jgi:hypothetical protein
MATALNLGFGASNPYVANQATALQNASNQNLQQTVLPGIGQGAQMAGGYGGSRQGIAQGIAAGNAQTGLDSATANLYSNAYSQDQNAQLQRDQMAAQSAIASMQNATAQRGQDKSYDLGMANNDVNRLGVNNQFTLGKGNLALGNRQADQSYGLGLGNLGLGYQNSNQQYNLGLGNLAVNNKQADNTFSLGQGQLSNQAQSNANSYDLGLRSNDLGFAGLDANINQNNVQNQLSGANLGLNAYNSLMAGSTQQINNGTTMQNTPLNFFNQFNQNANGIAGLGTSGTTTQNNPGNPWLGALGGWQLGNQFNKATA